jgi:hypothetical protein
MGSSTVLQRARLIWLMIGRCVPRRLLFEDTPVQVLGTSDCKTELCTRHLSQVLIEGPTTGRH